MADYEFIIVGAGLSGLSCAIELARQNKSFKIFEAGPTAGGRVQTDLIDGFRLDHGFQVFLTAYPESQKLLDYPKLNFRKFKSGAVIRFDGEFCRISDVLRHPGDLPGNLFSKAASFSDKLKIASLRSEVEKWSIDQIAESENVTTKQRLQQFGFSDKIVNSFFRPFFGGVFLETELTTSRRMFDFVFKMFAEGDVVVPAMGMGQISQQMTERVPADSLQFNSKVTRIAANEIEIESGQTFSADNIIVAADQNSARNLTGEQEVQWCSATCLYFAADQSPINEPIIVLNGDEDGPINNLCVPSDVSPAYAPNGKALISISVVGDKSDSELESKVLTQAKTWYGDQVESWQHIKTYEIPQALPSQSCANLETVDKQQTTDGIHFCGDYLNFASINGAMASGKTLAEKLCV